MRKSVEFDVTEGETSRQAHADPPAGASERKLGREGLFGATTHLDRRNSTAWSDFARPPAPPWPGNLLLHNAGVQIRIWRFSAPVTTLLRNSDGDELLFVHEGMGELFCDYGHLSYRDGDCIVMPRGTMWRLEPKGLTTLVLFEATNNSYPLPDRGIVGQHAESFPAMLDRPRIDEAFRAQQQGPAKSWLVAVKRRNQISTTTYPFNPLGATGRKGNLAPVRINWREIRLRAESPAFFG